MQATISRQIKSEQISIRQFAFQNNKKGYDQQNECKEIKLDRKDQKIPILKGNINNCKWNYGIQAVPKDQIQQ